MNDNFSFVDFIASTSKDQSTKVGVVFYDKTNSFPISFGYNGMPRGLDDSNFERNQRPEKYYWYEHAERNGIYNAVRPDLDGSMIMMTHFPNMESARAIVSVGLNRVVTFKADNVIDVEDVLRVRALFSECGVELVELDDISYDDKMKDKYVHYLRITREYANSNTIYDVDYSKGCLILGKNFNPIVGGVYGPPIVIRDKVSKEEVLENKSNWYQEEVKNAIYNIAKDKLKDSCVDVSWCPCRRCALALVSVDIKEVKTRKPDFTKEADLRWKEDFLISEYLFKNSGIKSIYIDVNNVNKKKLSRKS